jgi:hypothetical protein
MGVHRGLITLYPKDVRSFYLVGLETKVSLGVFDVTIEGGGSGGDEFVVRAKVVEWGYSRLSAVREFLTEESSKVDRTRVLTAFPAGLGHSVFFILARLGFDRRWFKVVNADPTIVPFKAYNDLEVLRNIAYLHAIHKLIVIDKLKKPLWIRHKTATPITHAILMKSNYNHNKHLIQQHVPRKIIEKLPRVTLA